MTGTNSSYENMFILRLNVEINYNEYFYATKLRNTITQSQRKCLLVQGYFKYQWYTIYYDLSKRLLV